MSSNNGGDSSNDLSEMKNLLIDFIKNQTTFNNKILSFVDDQKKFNADQKKFNADQKEFNADQKKFSADQMEFNKRFDLKLKNVGSSITGQIVEIEVRKALKETRASTCAKYVCSSRIRPAGDSSS